MEFSTPHADATGIHTNGPRAEFHRGSRRAEMRMAGMRWIDHWVGLPLCFALGIMVRVLRRILPRHGKAVSGERPIAVLKFFGLGSIVEATPMLRALRERYPKTPLVFVTFQSNERLLRRLNICTDLRIIRTDSPIRFVADVLSQILWLRRHRIEAVIDLEFFSKFSTLLAFMSGAGVRVGFHLNDFWRYSLLTHPICFNYFRHLADVYAQAAQRLNVSILDSRLSPLVPTEAETSSATQTLRNLGWTPGAPLLGINVNAGELSLERRWPLERFAELIRRLLAGHPDLFVVLTGSSAEAPYVTALVSRLPETIRRRTAVVAGVWTLEEFIAGLTLLDGFVTNDSGPLHLAAAVGVPTVSIWGPSRPNFYAPRVENLTKIYADYPCSPCVGMFTSFEGMWCNHEAWCMQSVATDEVLESVEKMLARSGRARSEALKS